MALSIENVTIFADGLDHPECGRSSGWVCVGRRRGGQIYKILKMEKLLKK